MMNRIKKKILMVLVLGCLFPVLSFAINPIISQRYTADPIGLEYKGRLYIYTSHDLDGQERYWMNDITCISTDDMQNWTDHGEVFKAPENISWASQAWAPTVIERNDTFFMYTGDGNRSVSVAISTSPTGPFVGVGGQPLITPDMSNAQVDWCFDPTAFIDDNGQAYLVFGGGPTKVQADGQRRKNARIIKLGHDLVSVDGAAVLIDAPGFYEGGYLSARQVNGKQTYYFSYFSNYLDDQQDIKYMMSDSPMEGWVYKGTVLNQPSENYNNSHAGVFTFKGQSYLAYHTRKIGTDRGVDAIRQRSVCVDALVYNEDGTIQSVQPTRQGPAQLKGLDPFVKQQAETMAAQSYLLPGIETDSCSDKGLGRMITEINNNDWIMLRCVDFGKGAKSFSVRVATPNKGGSIEVRLGSPDGQLIGTCPIEATGAWDKWNTQKCKVEAVSGTHDLYFKFTGGEGFLFNFNWWQFK